MGTKRRWAALLAALAAIAVASCHDEHPTAPEEATSATAPGDAVAEPPGAPLLQVEAAVLNCMGDHAFQAGIINGLKGPYDLNCTANDTRIGFVQTCGDCPVQECYEGEDIEIELEAELVANAKTRYDVGVWLSTDGGDAISGQCNHYYLNTPPPLDPTATPEVPAFPCGPDEDGDGTPDDECIGTREAPFWDAEDAGDTCGDMEQDVENILELGLVTLPCRDADRDGFLDADGCIAYHNSVVEPVCTDANAWAMTSPETKSKCRCRPLGIPVRVLRHAWVTVIKDLEPASDPGRFDLRIWSSTSEFEPDAIVEERAGAGDGQATNAYEAVWAQNGAAEDSTFFVDETAVAGPGATYYNTSYVCEDVGPNDRGIVASGQGMGPVQLTLQMNDDIECTFTNDRILPPTVSVTKTAEESFDRAWDWTLVKRVYKNGSPSGIEPCMTLGEDIEGTTQTLQLGQPLTACYVVTATPSATDANWYVEGDITVTVAGDLPPYSGTFTVSDVISGFGAATVDCDGTEGAPYVPTKDVSAAGSFTCTYFASLPDGSARTNTATASVTWSSGDPGGNSDTEPVTFGDPTVETDESATVTDVWNGTPSFTLGTADGADGAAGFHFSRELQCAGYGETLIPNDATLTTNDTPLTRTDDADVTVDCPADGCVLTQGFWKTHSEFGPAPYAAGWAELPSGASTPFGLDETGAATILSGETYYAVLHDPGSGGNMWVMVAHQYIAAWLNVFAGAASPAPVAAELEDAADLLAHYAGSNLIPEDGDGFCDTQGAGHACKAYGTDRAFAVYLNDRLTDYNEGLLGVDHCDDDASSL